MAEQRIDGSHLLPIKSAIFDELRSHTEDNYTILEIDLNTAKTDYEVAIQGTNLTVLYAPKGYQFLIRFNEPFKKQLILKTQSSTKCLFYRFFITTTINAGEKIVLFIGNNVEYKTDFTEIDDITIIARLTSIKDYLEQLNVKTISSIYETLNINQYTIPNDEATRILNANLLKNRRHLSIYNTSDEHTIYIGSSATNCYLPIPPLTERAIASSPFYQGEIWIYHNAGIGKTINVVVSEGLA